MCLSDLESDHGSVPLRRSPRKKPVVAVPMPKLTCTHTASSRTSTNLTITPQKSPQASTKPSPSPRSLSQGIVRGDDKATTSTRSRGSSAIESKCRFQFGCDANCCMFCANFKIVVFVIDLSKVGSYPQGHIKSCDVTNYYTLRITIYCIDQAIASYNAFGSVS